MIYLYIVLFVAIVYALFWFFSFKNRIPTALSMQVHYRFQEYPGQYSGSLRATHGALVFRGERYQDDISNIVVKDVRSTDSKVEVKLQQVLVLPFKMNEDTSSEVSVRFRVASDKAQRVDLTNSKVKIHAVVNYQNGEKKAFRTTLPMAGVYAHELSRTQNQFKI